MSHRRQFERGLSIDYMSRHFQQHTVSLRKALADIAPEAFFVAVLAEHKNPLEANDAGDYCWIKCKSATPFAKIRTDAFQKHEVAAGSIPNSYFGQPGDAEAVERYEIDHALGAEMPKWQRKLRAFVLKRVRRAQWSFEAAI